MKALATDIRRRTMLKRGSVFLISLASAPLVTLPHKAQAQKTAKSDMHYQDHPEDGKRCADCKQFIPPSDGRASQGSCRIVEGTISQNGWCSAFTPKS